MNRVGVLSESHSSEPPEPQPKGETGGAADDQIPPPLHELIHSPETLRLWHQRINMVKLNIGLSIYYTIIGFILFLFTAILHPHNVYHSDLGYCIYGYCYTREIDVPYDRDAHRHFVGDGFHPFYWHILLASLTLFVYGFLIWTKLTVRVVNMGHICNWITATILVITAVQANYHWDNPPVRHFSPFWFEGIVHSFFGPLILNITALCAVVQCVLNLPTLIVHHLEYYPEMALYSVSQKSDVSSPTDSSL